MDNIIRSYAELPDKKKAFLLQENVPRLFIGNKVYGIELLHIEFRRKGNVKIIPKFIQYTDEKVSYYYEGKPLYDRIKDDITEEGQVYQWRRQYVRKNMSGVCPTLTANMGTGGHNVPIIFDGKGIRKLTPRECFSIQGFPKDYKLPTTISDAALYKQAGNSVSVPVIARIAKNILKALE